MEIKGRKALVFGLKRSGVGSVHMLKKMGADVSATDGKTAPELKEYVEMLPGDVRLFLGGHPDEALDGVDIIVVSPGVPLDIKPLRAASSKGIKIIGELELAYQAVAGKTPFYAVTGTNGKSTTTGLLGLMLGYGGKKPLVGGNIGNAITEELFKTGEVFKTIVVEVSSFQLESIAEFRPKIASILNITPDHLDRYRTMDAYREAKEKIFINQREGDFLVLNAEDPGTMRVYNSVSGRGKDAPMPVLFSKKEKVRGVYLKDGEMWFDIPGISPRMLIEGGDIRIKGVHNMENAMAASAMALLAGCSPDAVSQALRDFPGLEHRLEFVRQLNGVRYINDSKGTNVAAAMKSIESFSSPIILIAGGRDKEGDFTLLKPLVKERVKAAVLIGEAKDKIAKAIEGLTDVRFAVDMKDALDVSKSIASEGDVVLLSPACASFDMFRDFEDRGRRFKEEVMGL
jgi:UDP-N-acetylmuramoylalanine--D-glutamate ligase